MFQTINLKQNSPTTEEALANFLIALEEAKFQKIKVLKLVHGYGSHGVGGAILTALKKELATKKRKKEIFDYIGGASWNLANPAVFELVTLVPECALDEDLNSPNIGITIVLLENPKK